MGETNRVKLGIRLQKSQTVFALKRIDREAFSLDSDISHENSKTIMSSKHD